MTVRLFLSSGTLHAGEVDDGYQLDLRAVIGLQPLLDRDNARALRDDLDRYLAEPAGQLSIDTPEQEPPAPSEPPAGVVPLRPDQPVVGPSPPRRRTSRKAALDNFPRTGTQRWRILQQAERAGSRGVTRDELVVALSMPPNVVCPRVLELVGGHWLTGARTPVRGGVGTVPRTRKTRAGDDAEVLVLTRKALDEVRAEREKMAGRG